MNASGAWDSAEHERARALALELGPAAVSDARPIAVRAPGRVNLIGEHTDYSGLPVLPIAIDRSTIIVAARSSSPEISLRNADRAWPPRSFRIERHIPPYPTGDWANYVKAAVQGVIDHFSARGTAMDRWVGAAMIVDGRVPPSAGLSSSAALTVSSALAFMAINGLKLAPIETASMVARSEWYVGTMAGGMDQAASLLGRRDHALLIEFEPLRVRPVAMPAEAALVVADSREVADKSGRVRGEYNRRVVECALAARIIACALKLDGVRILGDVVARLGKWDAPELVRILEATAPARLDPDLADAARIVGIARDRLADDLLGTGAARIILDPARPLEILRRARHVLGETERVYRAAAALEAGRLDEMGVLMNASHESLARDFECSTARLDRLVECARRGGALGARLTGAGFGGSIVALCRAGDAPGVIEALDREYYAALASGAPIESARAIVHAGAGASVIELAA
ncbi:MAG TPA: galactokinase [Candidatus Binataceae bacterium]|nr:galactokinase [Candidatus Binataceae bacterium]